MRTFQTLTLALILSTTLAPVETWAQDSTSSTSTTVTLTGSELAEVVEQACHEARSKAREADGLLLQRNDSVNSYNQCVGALRQFGGVDSMRLALVRELALVERENESRFGVVWIVVGVVGGLVAGGVIGWSAGKLL
jgi:hypothetical protein